MRSGVRLGLEVGKARIGVARSDVNGMLATPVETVPRSAADDSTSSSPGAGVAPEPDTARILEIVRELDAVEVIVGLPINMRGERTPSTEDAQGFAERLAGACHDYAVPVRLIDERLSTVSAQGQLRQTGKKTKQTRQIIDQVAAVVILQQALDVERASGEAPGHEVLADAGEEE